MDLIVRSYPLNCCHHLDIMMSMIMIGVIYRNHYHRAYHCYDQPIYCLLTIIVVLIAMISDYHDHRDYHDYHD